MRNLLYSIIEFWIPDQILDHGSVGERSRARTLTSFILIATFVYSVFLTLGFLNNITSSIVVNCIGIALFITALFLYKLRGAHRAAVTILLITPLSAMTFYQFKHGGFSSMDIVWAPLVPILSVLLLDRKAGFFWTSISSIAYVLPGIVQFEGDYQTLLYNTVAVLFCSFTCLALVLVYQEERIRAYAKLEGAISQKQGLINILTHDIANPLNVIKNANNIVSRKAEAEPVKKFSKSIERGCQIIADIIEHVREMQAIETEKKQVNLSPVDLTEIFKKAEFVFEDKLESKGVKLNLIKNDSHSKVLAEPISLSNNVFNNLISNAIKFSDSGSSIDVEVEEKDNIVRLRVSDHGVGMPKDISQNLFRPDKPTTRLGTDGEKGTGFGMPLVKAYVDKYQASIEVKSRTKDEDPKDHGTTFEIEFKKAA